MDVKLKFRKNDKRIAGLAEKLRKAEYNITISRPFHGSIPMMWVGESCYTGSENIVEAVADLLGQNE